MIAKMLKYYYAFMDNFLTRYWNQERPSNINVKVLMFHHICDEVIIGMPDSCVCKIDTFSEIITSYLDNGWQFLTPYDLILLKNKKGVIVTFDDITDDVYLNAFPILLKYNIPFTIFVTTDYIDSIPYITSAHLMEMANSPLCTIGSHTISHKNLRKTLDFKEEIASSKHLLEKMLGKPVDFFAYPYGKHSSVSKKLERYAEQVGYKAAFGTINASINDISVHRKYYYPRLIENTI